MPDRKVINNTLLLFFIALSFFLCYEFLEINIKSWDEAIYANNAVEMSKNGNWWALYNNGQPDLYNTKPPLVIWLQSIFISVWGINEFSVRLPSFISLFLLVIILFQFLQKRTNSWSFPFFSLSILLSSAGLLSFHGFATGDLDATLCLWTTIYSVIVLDKIILCGEKPNSKWIYFTGLFFILAFLTKSTAAFLPLPGLLINVFIFNKQKWLFLNKHFYIMCLLVILLIVGYYYMMEIRRPGYFHHAWDSEYKRIYTNVMPWHTQPFGYYFKNLSTRFFPWCWVLIPSILLGLRSKTVFIKKLTVFSAGFSISYLIAISIPAVKLEWYDLPAYPFLAVLSSVIFFEVWGWLKSSFSNRRLFLPAFFLLFTIIAATTLITIVNSIKHPRFKEPLEREGIALRGLMKEPVINSLKILMWAEHPEHYNQVNFYREMYLSKKGYRPEMRFFPNELLPGDSVLTCQLPKEYSLTGLTIDTIKKINDCFLIHILKSSKFPPEQLTK